MDCATSSLDGKNTKRANAIDAAIGKRLRKWRIAQNIDAIELARTVGVTYQQLQKYEKGQTRIAASRLYELARALNVPVDWFFQEPGNQSDNVASSSDDGEDGSKHKYSGRRLLQHYLKIEDPDVRRAFMELMETLAAAGGTLNGHSGEPD